MPRELFDSTVELGLALESTEPPLGLTATEVKAIIGRPGQITTENGFPEMIGGNPGFDGMRSFSREHYLHYCCDNGRMLVYEYEGALAYALAEIHVPEEV